MPNSPVAGLAIATRRVKDPQATIICVHGGLDRGGSFARLARRTSQFDLVAYDRRGYQGSRALSPVTLALHVDDLATVAQHEAANAPIIFFGHSFGGVITFATAFRAPLLAALVVNYESPLPWILARTASRPTPSADPALEAENFFRRVVSTTAWLRLSEFEKESRRLDGSGLLSDLAMVGGGAPFDLAALQTPAAYLHGDQLRAPYYRELCREIVRLNPAVTTRELVGAGHGAHLTHPDQLAMVLGELWEQRCVLA